jgi:hypothetical protein
MQKPARADLESGLFFDLPFDAALKILPVFQPPARQLPFAATVQAQQDSRRMQNYSLH